MIRGQPDAEGRHRAIQMNLALVMRTQAAQKLGDMVTKFRGSYVFVAEFFLCDRDGPQQRCASFRAAPQPVQCQGKVA